jgi:mRNA-degrading endonuclease HigB of HigAB toxin-antitoxin module
MPRPLQTKQQLRCKCDVDVDVDVDADEKIVLSIKSTERNDVATIRSSFSACYITKLCKHKLFQS